MLEQKLGVAVQITLDKARKSAQTLLNENVGIPHLLLGLIQNMEIGKGYGFNVEVIKERTEQYCTPAEDPSVVELGQLPFTPGARKALEAAVEIAEDVGSGEASAHCLLYGILSVQKDNPAAGILKELSYDLDDLLEHCKRNISYFARFDEHPHLQAFVGKTAKQIMELALRFEYRDSEGKECTIHSWNRGKGIISVAYKDGRIKEYNDIVGLSMLKTTGVLKETK